MASEAIHPVSPQPGPRLVLGSKSHLALKRKGDQLQPGRRGRPAGWGSGQSLGFSQSGAVPAARCWSGPFFLLFGGRWPSGEGCAEPSRRRAHVSPQYPCREGAVDSTLWRLGKGAGGAHVSTSGLASSTSLKVLSKQEGLKHCRAVLFCFSFSYRCPKVRTGLRGKVARQTSDMLNRKLDKIVRGPEPGPADTQVQAPQGAREPRDPDWRGCAQPPPHPRAISAEGLFLRGFPPVCPDGA